MDLPRHLPLANPLLACPGAGLMSPLSGGGEVEQLRAELTRAQQNLHAAQLKIQALTLELAHLKRLRFGPKSEALAHGQGDLFAETALIDQAAIEAELERVANQINPATRRLPRVRAGRQPLPDHLPRIEHRHEPASCQCGLCGKDLVKRSESH
jgi:transposase